MARPIDNRYMLGWGGMLMPDWFKSLMIVVEADESLKKSLGFRITFEAPSGVRGIDLSTGDVLEDTVPTACGIRASDAVFQQLVSGSLTMQTAYVRGDIAIVGDPELALKLYTLFDACALLEGSECAKVT